MKKILIVEGNLREENQSFTDGGIKTHTESLKDSISYFTKNLEIESENDKFLKIVKNITSKGFVRSNYEEKLVDLSDVRINLKTKN